jgi:ribosomal protein S6E (S10)
MKKLVLFAALFTATGLYAQKTIQDEHAQKRNAKNFHAIEVSDGIDLYLSQGSEESLAVSASSPEYRDKIHSEVVNGVLKIYYERDRGWGVNWGNRKLKAYVSVKTLDKLHASGGSDVAIDNELTSNSLSMELSGGSDFKGRINAQSLSISASGGSDAYLSGRADKLKLEASGGSDIHGYDMVSNYCSSFKRG